ncbi:MAG: hypothetical protein EBZ74_01945 [Planctomycetia bacterium]|nr:hypothetical protein [Planctomycetia bacterium]
MVGSERVRWRWGAVATGAGLVAAGLVLGLEIASRVAPPRVQALTSLADDAFAVCTVPLGGGIEGFFILDFETGDLSGGVLNPSTGRFAGAYKHNVLQDLGFKAGQVKNPRFLLVSGAAELQTGGAALAPAVLYVTDSSTGTTVAYGIPFNPQQAAAGAFVTKLELLDVARPRGGGGKAGAAAKARKEKEKD